MKTENSVSQKVLVTFERDGEIARYLPFKEIPVDPETGLGAPHLEKLLNLVKDFCENAKGPVYYATETDWRFTDLQPYTPHLGSSFEERSQIASIVKVHCRKVAYGLV